jgi:hypothetical protein
MVYASELARLDGGSLTTGEPPDERCERTRVLSQWEYASSGTSYTIYISYY